MKQYIIIISLAILCVGSNVAQNSDTARFLVNEITIFADKLPIPLLETPRNVTIITLNDIANSASNNIQDLLGYFAGVDIKRRGQEGAQADISTRGSSYEQTLILLNGVRLTDPQTGHHNLNLPVNIDDIERIEIVKGQASSIYGANALGGVINIITKRNFKNEATFHLAGGENSFNSEGASVKYVNDHTENSLSVSRTRSAGYRPNTDFNLLTIFGGSTYYLESGNSNINMGYTEKSFGANQFYSDKYPAQWEETKTFFISTNSTVSNNSFSFSPTVFWRHNYDHYLLDYAHPSFYENVHRTNVYGIDLQSRMKTSIGDILFGSEFNYAELNSNRLGNHNRSNVGATGEFAKNILPTLNILLSGNCHLYDSYGWRFAPGLDIGYQLNDKMRIFSSIGKSYRIPSFTELYYNSPSQIGNINLQSEEAIALEIGFSTHINNWQFQVNAFERRGANYIDWVKKSNLDTKWQAENITSITTKGFESTVEYSPDKYQTNPVFKSLKLDYSYLYSDFRINSYQSQYALEHLKHQVIISVLHNLFYDITGYWAFKYLDRFNQESAFVTDIKILKSWQLISYNIAVTNIFNVSYREVGVIPMPGRWMKLEINFKIQ